MAVTLAALVATMERLWPLSGAELWDKPGLVAGNPTHHIKRVLLSVDLTASVLAEAQTGDYQLIVNHHPFLLRGIHSVAEVGAKGAILSQAIRSGIAIYAAHTNADVVRQGTSDLLSLGLALKDATPLNPGPDAAVGIGRIGNLSEATSLRQLVERLSGLIPKTTGGIRVAGMPDAMVRRVALCAGAGDSLLEAVLQSDADVYITSDLRHHTAQEAREQALARGRELALVDISHWAAESLWLKRAASELGKHFPDLEIAVSEINTDPWTFAVIDGQLIT